MTDAEHDFQFPSNLSYENPLVGAVQEKGFPYGMNFIMRDGTTSELPYRIRPEFFYTEVRIPQDSSVSKVFVWYDNQRNLAGFKFFPPEGQCILVAGSCTDYWP